MTAGSAATRLVGLCVLIVEDEMLLALDYEATLRAAGCSVLGPVPQASKAMALLENERPDAAILDLNLNGHKPTSLAETLLERGVPFLIVSGYGSDAMQEPVFRAAPRLVKPLKRDQLLDAVARLARA